MRFFNEILKKRRKKQNKKKKFAKFTAFEYGNKYSNNYQRKKISNHSKLYEQLANIY